MAEQCSLAERVEKNLAPSAAYKDVLVTHHPNFHEFMQAQDTIKKYIQQRGLILYGGTAIDYALRLRGDKIYEDTELPDLDFWSPNHIETIQELLNILSVLFPSIKVYATRAKYVKTTRVSVGQNNWVADITYIPRELFDKIPTLTFDGMRVVHPHYQFSDLHSSLAFPYDGAPMEVVFSRWKKDIARFNKLFTAYPLPPIESSIPSLNQVGIPREIITHSILQSFAAYSLYYNALLRALAPEDSLRLRQDQGVPHAREPKIDANDVMLDTSRDCVEIMAHRDIFAQHLDRQKIDASEARAFYPLLDLLESSIMVQIRGTITLIAYSTFSRLINYHSFEVSGIDFKIRAVGIHGLLKHFIVCYLRAKYFSHAIHGPIIEASTYLNYYLACLQLIKISRGTSVEYLFDPTVTVFGESSIPLHNIISLYQDVSALIGARDDESPTPKESSGPEQDLCLPPKNMRATGARDFSSTEIPIVFNYDKCPLFKISAEEKI